MHQREHTVDLLERALRAMPFCPGCGEHTDVVEVGSDLVLRCSAIDRPKTGIDRWLGSLVGPAHVAYPIAEVPTAQAA